MTIYSGFSHWKWWFSIVMLVHQSVSQIPFLPGLRFSKALLGRVGVYLFGKSMKYDLRWTLQDWLSTIDLLIYLDDLGCTSRLVISLTCHSFLIMSRSGTSSLFLNMTTWMDWEHWMGPIPSLHDTVRLICHGAPANRYKTTVTLPGRQAGSTLCTVNAPYRDWNEQLTDSWNVRDIHFVSVFGALDQQVQQIRMQSDTIFRLQTRLQSLELEAMAWNGPNQWINTNTVPLKCTHQSLKHIYWTVLTWVICRLCSYYRTTYVFFWLKNNHPTPPSYVQVACRAEPSTWLVAAGRVGPVTAVAAGTAARLGGSLVSMDQWTNGLI